jgi:hypothetical protein
VLEAVDLTKRCGSGVGLDRLNLPAMSWHLFNLAITF